VNEDRSRQLTLPFPLEHRCTLANFEAGGNAEQAGQQESQARRIHALPRAA
jgi:hypothetical protein